MGILREVFTQLHNKTERDYIGRMQDEKVFCMEKAKEYGYDYWDGDRRFGYGGYKYDGRWEDVAKKIIDMYGLTEESSVLDVGCGKAYLIFEIKKLLPGIRIKGFDFSDYALENAKPEIKDFLFKHKAQDKYPFADKEFDLAISFTTLHNLEIFDLKTALGEIERVGKSGYIVVESYRNEEELFNLECWALTCESFFSPKEWIWLFDEFGFSGDYEFIYF